MKHYRIDRDDEHLNKIIQRRFSVSCMSDHKWVKVLNALVEHHYLIKEIRVKLIWDDTVRNLAVSEHTSYNFDYYDTAMEAMISGSPTGWYAYKEIEWLRFPSFSRIPDNKGDNHVKECQETQDLHAIYDVFEYIGQFEMELHDDALTVYAYK